MSQLTDGNVHLLSVGGIYYFILPNGMEMVDTLVPRVGFEPPTSQSFISENAFGCVERAQGKVLLIIAVAMPCQTSLNQWRAGKVTSTYSNLSRGPGHPCAMKTGSLQARREI